MRPSKSRSRGKNRSSNRSPANNINRVFDSSGPEGKVRGTPQQIIDKYLQLARDAFLGNDRVAAENFQQHAEHYTRLLTEAQRDAEEKRIQSDQQNRDRQQPQMRGRERDERDEAETPDLVVDFGSSDQPHVIEPIGAPDDDDPGLVETPETQPKPKRKPSRSRTKPKPKAAGEGEETPAPEPAEAGSSEAAE